MTDHVQNAMRRLHIEATGSRRGTGNLADRAPVRGPCRKSIVNALPIMPVASTRDELEADGVP